MSRKKTKTSAPGPDAVESSEKKTRGRKDKTAKAERPPAMIPAVNLLSPWALEELKVHTLRSRFILGGVALALVIGTGFGVQTFRLIGTNSDLEVAQEKTAELTADINKLTPVANYVADVEDRGALISESMLTEVEFGSVLTQLRAVTPAALTLETASATIPGPLNEDVEKTIDEPTRGLNTSCGGPDPFAVREVIGCATISGTAVDRRTVGEFVDALEASGMFVEPFISSTQTSPTEPITFSGTVGVSPEAFSGRFDTLADEAAGKTPETSETEEQQ